VATLKIAGVNTAILQDRNKLDLYYILAL